MGSVGIATIQALRESMRADLTATLSHATKESDSRNR
jgi:hypothetical protein